MKIAGIVAEYNPFHLGHQYQCNRLRTEGYDGIVAVMSGNFVQRADVAVTDKYRRAQGAVASGVDLVLELPLPYAVASAEDFARGGIEVLAATGIIDTLCCGCESGDEANRRQFESLCCAEEEGRVGQKMKLGLSYPAACRAAVTERGDCWSEEPNDVLALAYRKALKKIAPHIPLFAIERKGSFHGDGSDGFESAQSIRKRLLDGQEIAAALPPTSYSHLQDAPLAQLSLLERAILAYYRTAEAEQLKNFYAMREGLAQRIVRAADASSLAELFDRVKTKRFPHSAVRRAVLCGYLKIPATLPPVSYLRVLAFNERGQKMLRRMKKEATLPVYTVLPPKIKEDPLGKIQLTGDEIFALATEKPAEKYRDLTYSAKKTADFGN